MNRIVYYKLIPVGGTVQLVRVVVPTGLMPNMMIRVSGVETPDKAMLEIMVDDYQKIPYIPKLFNICESLRDVVTIYDIENRLIEQGFQRQL